MLDVFVWGGQFKLYKKYIGMNLPCSIDFDYTDYTMTDLFC